MSDGTERLFELSDGRPPWQGGLPDPGRASIGKAFTDAPDTTRAAARAILPRSGTWRRAVLDVIAERGIYGAGATDEEIQSLLGVNPSTERPRRVELVEDGWVRDSGVRRNVISGQRAIVWILTDAGREALRA